MVILEVSYAASWKTTNDIPKKQKKERKNDWVMQIMTVKYIWASLYKDIYKRWSLKIMSDVNYIIIHHCSIYIANYQFKAGLAGEFQQET